MENLGLLKDRITDRILKQTRLEEFNRDPLGYSFIYWKLSSNSINLEINKDIKRSIQDWLRAFLDNLLMNDFIDRNATATAFIFHNLNTEIGFNENDFKKIFPLLKKNYDKSSCLFFKNLLYTTIIIDSLSRITLQDSELINFLGEVNNKVKDSMGKETVFNDPKIFPFLCEHFVDEDRRRFIDLIKKQVEVNQENIVDMDKIYYAWAIIRYREFIDKERLSFIHDFVASAVSVVRSLLETLSDETLENLYGKNVRDALPFYWLVFAYELVANYNSFLSSISSDFESRMRHLLSDYGLESIYKNYSIAKGRIQSATVSSDTAEKQRLSTEVGYYLGLVLEGTLKFICHKIASESFPDDKYSTFSQAIEHALKKLKDKKYRYISHKEHLDREITDLTDKFRNIADHFKVDKEVLVLKGKFQPKQIGLEEATMCLGKTQIVISMLLERLKERLKT